MGDNTDGGKVSRPSKFLVGCVLDAVVEWDLTEDEKPVPVTDEAKKKYFAPLLGILIKDAQTCLATEIFEFARDGGNFLKN
jgi:hypothetical protein